MAEGLRRGLSQMFNYLGQNIIPMMQYQQQQKLEQQRQVGIESYRDWQMVQQQKELDLRQQQFDLREKEFLYGQEQDYQAGLEKQFVGGLKPTAETAPNVMQKAILAKRAFEETGLLPAGFKEPRAKTGTTTTTTTTKQPSFSDIRQYAKDLRESEITRLSGDIMTKFQEIDPDLYRQFEGDKLLPSQSPVDLASFVSRDFAKKEDKPGWFTGDTLIPYQDVQAKLDTLRNVYNAPLLDFIPQAKQGLGLGGGQTPGFDLSNYSDEELRAIVEGRK